MVCDRVINSLLAMPFTPLHKGRGKPRSGAGEGLLFVCAARERGSCLLSSVTYFLYILTFYCKFLDLQQILLTNQQKYLFVKKIQYIFANCNNHMTKRNRKCRQISSFLSKRQDKYCYKNILSKARCCIPIMKRRKEITVRKTP